jgi:alpha-beta hydrolase superfamily lysophospholipase
MLSGTIVFPQVVEPVAAVVLVHWSGPTTRMLWLAHLFASEGIAAMTYDKRGTGRSGGTFVGGRAAATAENFDLLGADAAAAAALASRHPRLTGASIGLVGISQGGWIGPVAAAKSPEVDFMVFFSGPVATVCEEDHFSDLAEGNSSFWTTHSRQEVSEYMTSAICGADDVDPSPVLDALRIPAFWTFGGRDNVMPVDVSVTRLKALVAKGHFQFRYRVYPNNGHELIVFEIPTLSLSAAFRDTVDWIKQTAAAAQQAAAPVGRIVNSIGGRSSKNASGWL